MTKTVNKKDLVVYNDVVFLPTKEDFSKYTKVIAQTDTDETLYVVDKVFNGEYPVKVTITIEIMEG